MSSETTTSASQPSAASGLSASAGRRKRRWLWPSVISAVVLAGGGAALLFGRGKPIVPPTAPPGEVIRFVATDEFNKLPPEKLKGYIDEFEKNRMKFFLELPKLSEEERQKAGENFFRTIVVHDARTYAALPPAEKKAFLDKAIERQQNFRPPGGVRPGGGPPGGNRGPGNSPERMKARMENLAPGDRAAMAQYFADLASRRAERGLPGFGR